MSKVGRKLKDGVHRKVYSIRLTPDAYEFLSVTADKLGISVSDLIQNYAIQFCKQRLDYNWPCVKWS